jgi:hypothetical protein
MSKVVLLDSGPLGMYSNQANKPKNRICKQRVEALLASGVAVKVPGIADYEVRRELLRQRLRDPSSQGVMRLDAAIRVLGLIPITGRTMDKAAEIWAQVRHKGFTTAPKEALDGDVILVAQAEIEVGNGDNVEIATTNSSDLQRLFAAILNWDDLKK